MKKRSIVKRIMAILMSCITLLVMTAASVFAEAEVQAESDSVAQTLRTYTVIIVVLVIVVVALVLFFVFRMKKMSEEIKNQAAVRQQPVFTPVQGMAPVSSTTVLSGAGMEGTTVLGNGAGMEGTTVLGNGAGMEGTTVLGSGFGTEGTTVLNTAGDGMVDPNPPAFDSDVTDSASDTNQPMSSGAALGELFRVKTGTKVTINKNNFKIGRQRDSVDYCIDDNNAVGRLHAVIVGKNGAVYIKDNRSTNGTFVNNVRVRPNGESLIATGDRVTIADEVFTFTAY